MLKRISCLSVLVIGFVIMGLAACPNVANAQVLINELLASHTGTDNSEYIELYGIPGFSLDGLSVIGVEGDNILSQSRIDRRVDFGAADVIGSNGFFLIGNPVGLATNYGVSPNVVIGNNFLENSSATYAIVQTSSIVGDSVASSEVVVDAVAATDGDAGDVFYFGAPVIGPDGSYFPAGVARKQDGVDTDTVADWRLADFSLGPTNTPGSSNNIPVKINELLASHTGTDNSEYIELYGIPGFSLDGLSVIGVEGDNILSQSRIDRRVDFGAADVIGSNGFFLIGNPVGLATNYGVSPNVVIGNNFLENSSATYAIVQTSSIVGDSVASSEVVVDAVAATDGGAGDVFYFGAPVIGPDGPFFPAGVARIADGVDTDTVFDWQLADFFLGPPNSPTSGVVVLQPDLWAVEYRFGDPPPGFEWDPFPLVFRSWLYVQIQNTGDGDAFNVTATITGMPANVTINDGDVIVGDIPTGGSAWSADDFTLEVDMTNPQDPNEGIFWTIEYDDSAGNHHIVENVPEFPPAAPPLTEKLPLWYPQKARVSRAYQNFPNPFNPETWIPYQIAEAANVTVAIFDIKGQLIRTIDLGHRPADFYTTKDKAAYWDGKNEAGEQVSSGAYFYTIQAGDLVATKKMVVTR